MSKRTQSYLAKCPYYRCEDSHRVFCEGTENFTGLQVSFSNPKQRFEYEGRYCKTLGYDKCIVAQIHDKRWEEIDNEVYTGISTICH